ncbi:MAG: hypothetical protein V4764_02470 [Burkholderia sp.]
MKAIPRDGLFSWRRMREDLAGWPAGDVRPTFGAKVVTVSASMGWTMQRVAISTVTWVDWGGWLVSNVVIGALAPCLLLCVARLGAAVARLPVRIDLFAPVRHGQLGFVALGWTAAAQAEVLGLVARGRLGVVEMLAAFGMLVPAGIGAMLAALGAIVPVAPPAQRPISALQWIKHHVLFSVSLGACMLVLTLSVFIHYAAVQGGHDA